MLHKLICVLSLYRNRVLLFAFSRGCNIAAALAPYKTRRGLCLKALWASSMELTARSLSTVGWVKYVPFMGKSSGLSVGVSKLVWMNKSWLSSSRIKCFSCFFFCLFLKKCLTFSLSHAHILSPWYCTLHSSIIAVHFASHQVIWLTHAI